MTSEIRRDARVVAAGSTLGRVRYVIVDPKTREPTSIIVGGLDAEIVVPITAVTRYDGDNLVLAGDAAQYRGQQSFERENFHAVDEANTVDQGGALAAQVAAADSVRDPVPTSPVVDDEAIIDAGERERRGSALSSTAVGEAAADESEELDTGVARRTQAQGATAATAVDPTADEFQVQLNLKEEQLRVGTELVEAGVVLLRREVVEHTESVEVTLREEHLVIEPQAGSGVVMVGDRELREGETLRLPIMKERVLVKKEPVWTDSFVVRKQQVSRQQQVTEVLRREELVVDDPGGLVLADGAETSTGNAQPQPAGALLTSRLPDNTPRAWIEDVTMENEQNRLNPTADEDLGRTLPMPSPRGRSGQLSPGGAEYNQEQPAGPAGTDRAVGPASTDPPGAPPAGNSAAQIDQRDEIIRR